jgi:hypothetical protein
MFWAELVPHPHIVHNLWNQKQRIEQNEGRSIKVTKEQPDIHKNGTIKNTVSIQICHSLYNAFKLSYQLHTYQYLHASTNQQQRHRLRKSSHTDYQEKCAQVNVKEHCVVQSDY